MILPDHVTFLMPPGREVVTGNAAPVKNVFPGRPNGTVVTHVPVNVVDAVVSVGENVTSASGTTTLISPSAELIVTSWNWMVTGTDLGPLPLRTLLNQIVRPDGMGVPSKVAA